MERSDLLYAVLKDLQDAGVLDKIVLIGSWCQDIYRHQFDNPVEIPATRTTDADVFIPRRLKLAHPVDVAAMLTQRGFVPLIHRSGVIKFIHRDLTFEFLTDPGAKPEEGSRSFKDLNIIAQELHFMAIPDSYHHTVEYRGLTLNVPEPEAFALHKLIVSQRRRKVEKREKDIEAARGMLLYFRGKEKHVKRLHRIIEEMPKGWQKTIKKAFEKTGLELPKII